MGYQPTQEYIEKTYNLKTTLLTELNPKDSTKQGGEEKGGQKGEKEGEENKDSKLVKNSLNGNLIPFKLPLNKNLAFDAIDNWTENLKLKDFDIDSILQNAKSYEEALELMEKSLQGEELEIAEALLAEAMMNAQIYGVSNG